MPTTTIRKQIWCFWEPENTLPPYLRLCLRTVEKNAGVPVELLTARDVEALAPGLDADLASRATRLGQRSDYYRAHLLAAQGGMWLDVDAIVVRDINWAFDEAQQTGFAARRNQIGISTTPLIAEAGSPVLGRWIGLQEDLLRKLKPGEDLLPWTVLGSTSLTAAIENDVFSELPRSRVAPLPWTQSGKYLSRFARPDRLLRREVSIVNLYNERFPAWLKAAPENELLESRIMLSRLLRVVLGISKLEDEQRRSDAVGTLLEATGGLAMRAVRSADARVRRLSARLRSS